MLAEGDYRIVLASKSPRRSQLLGQAGLPFIVRTQDVEEDFPSTMPVEEVAEFLAKKKASAAIGFLEKPGDVILAADSIVILDGTIYGKPQNRDEAHSMLGQLSGREHTVITGVCLQTKEQVVSFSDHSQVKFAPLSTEEIAYYVDQYQPFDKAGSYAIQEWIGLCKIEWIKGTYANIMGLPVQKVYTHLEELLK